MPSLKDIRRRITSVRKTQQITRAMRMVSAAKLRRAQDAIESARPYADRMRDTVAELAASPLDAAQPLLTARDPVRRVDFLVVTSDRGLCGAFNMNVAKLAEAEIAAREASVESVGLLLVGTKGADYFRRRRNRQIVRVVPGLGRVEYEHAVRIAAFASERFLSGQCDELVLIHSVFVSTLSQRPQSERLLPFGAPTAAAPAPKAPLTTEPTADRLLGVLLPKALQVEIFRALLDNQAGEHAARMTAMESATRNTDEMIGALSLQYNRARQAAITKELVEIVSGAEAL
ncbi:MAG TPA: ATP synthase F1 subunit gamma [Myxococcota bacterium]|nr:ATP synthase F1 subunit gamma [Myxococcota bacterium]